MYERRDMSLPAVVPAARGAVGDRLTRKYPNPPYPGAPVSPPHPHPGAPVSPRPRRAGAGRHGATECGRLSGSSGPLTYCLASLCPNELAHRVDARLQAVREETEVRAVGDG